MASSAYVASFSRASSSIYATTDPKCCTSGSYATRGVWKKSGKLSKEYCTVTSLQHNLKHRYQGGYKCDKSKRKYFMNATSIPSDQSEPQARDSKSILESMKDLMNVLRSFITPYASIALVLSITSSALLAVDKLSDLSPTTFIGLLQYLVTFLVFQIYNLGVNQLADIEIDKINKPYLPLASGMFSSRMMAIIIAAFLFMSLGFAWFIGSRPMFWAVFIGFVLSTAYSMNLPLLRWKRYPMLTLVYMISPTIAWNLGPFLHMKTYVLKRAATYPKPLIFAILINATFWSAMMFAKDIPDIEGDKAEGIRTMAVRLGPNQALMFCVSLLQMGNGIAILMGATSTFLWSKILTVLAHAIMALILWYHAKSVDLGSKSSMQSFYMIIFKLYYVECILIPFVR